MPEQKSRLVIEIDSVYAKQNAQALARELESIEKKGEFATKSMDSMSVSVRNLAGYMAGLVTVGSAIARMDDYTNLNNRLRLVTNSQQELNQAMRDTFDIAQRAGAAWGGTAAIYQKIQYNSEKLGLSQEKVAKITESISKSISNSGSSAQAASAALYQLGQAFDKSSLNGDEFVSMSENAGYLMEVFSKGLGVTRAELKEMSSDGELTTDKMVQAISKMAESIEGDFNKTNFTIGQSITQLSNAATQFTGSAGESSGAASMLSSSIKTLADNINLIANVAVLGGVALLTRAIVTQTIAVKASINATIERRLAMTTDLQMQTQLAAVEVQRTRLAAAQALTEINLARAEFNSATTRQARAAATMRLTQAEIAHNIAVKNSTVAIAAQTAAENALNTSRAVGARMLALVGGPIGAITLGVTALAAGYMYFSSRAAEANEKLEEQAQVANKTKGELLALEGAQRQSAKSDLASAFESQNKALNDLNQQFNSAVISLQNYAAKNQVSYESLEKIRDISNKVRQGIISQDEAIKQINKLYFVTPDQINQITDLNQKYEEQRIKTQKTADAQAVYGIKVTLSGNAASNAVPQIDQNTQALDDNAAAASNAAKAHQDYLKNIQSQAFDDIYTTGLMSQGRTPAQAKAILELQKAKGESAILTQEEISQALRSVALTEERSRAEQRYASSISKRSKVQSDATRKAQQEARDTENILKEQKNLREQYTYAYADREKQIEISLAKEIEDIRNAKFKDPNPYLEAAHKRAYLEKQIYLSQLQYEINEFQMSEEQKLKYSFEIKQLQVQRNTELTEKNKQIALSALSDQYQYESDLIQLAKEQRIFQFEQAMYSEMDLIQKRYEFELREAEKLKDPEERSRRINATELDKKQAENDLIKSLTGDYLSVMGFDENPLIKQFEVLQRARENDLINEEQYQNAKLQLQTKSTASYLDGMFGGFAELVDENSKTYAVLFAAQKAFAVAQAMLNIPAAYSKAYDAVVGTPYVGPYIAPAVGAAAAALQVAQASSMKSVNFTGYSDGGFTGYGAKYDPAGIVHKGEVVWSQEDIKRWGGVAAVESMRTSQPPKGYANGGIVSPKDTNRMAKGQLDAIQSGANLQAERQAQANAKVQAAQPSVNLNPNFVIVDERESLSDYLFSPDGTKAFVKFFKRNRSALGI